MRSEEKEIRSEKSGVRSEELGDKKFPVSSLLTPYSSLPTPHSSGVLVVDKPEGITSFDVVAKVRRWFRFKKVGHCGTLDPFATGVLVLCINQATRVADQLSGQDKVYRFTLTLGVETDTLDKTGEVVQTYSGPPRTESEFGDALEQFRGRYLQQVPRYAAVKVQGRRLYDWTRRGIEVELPQREVHIYRLSLLSFKWPEAVLEAHCSKGTYIRQLAADLGQILECGAHVSQLRRLSSGPFRLEQAVSLEELQELRAGNTSLPSCEEGDEKIRNLKSFELISLNDSLAHLPAILITEEEVVKRLRDGYLDSAWEAKYRADFAKQDEPVRLVAESGQLLALWWPHSHQAETGTIRRLRVFQ